MASWQQFGTDLPAAEVNFMFINYAKNKIRIGTQRGIYENDLAEDTPPKANIAANTNSTPCGQANKVQFADFSVLRDGPSTKYSWSFPGAVPNVSTLERPQVYYLQAGKYDVTLTVTDQFGSNTQTLTNFMTVTGNCPTGIGEENDSAISSDLIITPNPSKTSVNIFFTLSQTANTEMTICDMLGKVVKVIANTQQLNQGQHNFQVDISSLKRGTYFCKLNVDGTVKSKILVKE
jgi:PKD repeat protein